MEIELLGKDVGPPQVPKGMSLTQSGGCWDSDLDTLQKMVGPEYKGPGQKTFRNDPSPVILNVGDPSTPPKDPLLGAGPGPFLIPENNTPYLPLIGRETYRVPVPLTGTESVWTPPPVDRLGTPPFRTEDKSPVSPLRRHTHMVETEERKHGTEDRHTECRTFNGLLFRSFPHSKGFPNVVSPKDQREGQ